MKSNGNNNLIETQNWDPSLKFIIEQMNGEPLNVHKLMAKHPKLLKAWWNFRNYSVEGGDLGKRHGELVILRVASNLKSWYEWSSHVDRSLNCGISLNEIQNVNKKLDCREWSQKEFLLLSTVDQLIKDKQLEKKQYKLLQKFFSDQQILDIVAIHGMYLILGCMINIWELELEPKIAARLPNTIKKELFFKFKNHTI